MLECIFDKKSMEPIRLEKRKQHLLDVAEVCIDDSKFVNVMGQHLLFNNVNLSGMKIINANLSDLEIEGAQIGGAHIHNIGMPPQGHPLYNPDARMRPVLFEDCNLTGSEFRNCDLSGVAINGCTINGMTIDGIDVTAALKAYREAKP